MANTGRAFIRNLTIKIHSFKKKIGAAFIRKGRLIERGIYLKNQLSYGGV